MAQSKRSEINFLKEGAARSWSQLKKTQSIRKKSILLALAWLLVWAGVESGVIFYNQKYKKLKKEEAYLNQELKRLDPKVSRIFILKERLGKIEKIISSRPQFFSPLSNFFASLPPDLHISDVQVNSHTIQVTGEGNILAVAQLVEAYTDGKKATWFQGATLQSLTKQEKGLNFDFSLNIKF